MGVWKHCDGMQVGYTYEIHWPHSNLGECNTKWQYQSHFMDGVLCGANKGGMTPEEALAAVFQPEKAPSDRDAKIGVHAQVFTLTNNDEDDHAEWDMMTGFNPALATNVAIYQGSTTGQMKAIKTDGGDDMHSDMVPHNSRTTTETSITTDIAMPVGVNKGR